MNTQLFDRIAATSSPLSKQALLRECDEVDKRFLAWALDPMVTFGITVDPDITTQWHVPASKPSFWFRMDELCGQLSRRELTGHTAVTTTEGLIRSAPTADDARWAARVINKDLRAGMGASTVNKVFPGLVFDLEVMLAYDFEKVNKEGVLRGEWIWEPKLDGLRMIVIDGIAYSRNWRRIETVDHIVKHLDKGLVWDGEVMGESGFDKSSGKTRKKGAGSNEELVYNVFDVVDRDDWKSRSTPSLHDRKLMLGRIEESWLDHLKEHPEHDFIRFVSWYRLPVNSSFGDLCKIRDEAIDAWGYEGIMLKDLSAPYEFGRSRQLLKLKRFYPGDGVVVGWQEGRGKHKGLLGSLLVEFDGVVSKVGSGFSDADRKLYWETKEQLLGRVVEAEYQNKTDDGCLRFPTFVGFRPDKE